MRKIVPAKLLAIGLAILLLAVGLSRCANQLPRENDHETLTASCYADPISGTAPLTVDLTCSVTAEDRSISSYFWDFGDGTTSTEKNPTHIFQKSGTFIVTFIVTDSGGATSVDALKIIVEKMTNKLPTAVALASITYGESPLTVSFIGSGMDSDGAIESYQWDFDDGATSNKRNATHTFQNSGTYEVMLMVTDDDGAIGTATIIITVDESTGNQDHTEFMTWLKEKLDIVRTCNNNLDDGTEEYDALATNTEQMQVLMENYITELHGFGNLSDTFEEIRGECRECFLAFKQACNYTCRAAIAMVHRDFANAKYYLDLATDYKRDVLECIVRIMSLLGWIQS